jgi:DNA-binding transcriptional ArsR family regulator
MSSGIASLHKILKDKTRQKIIILLHEKGRLSYTDLMAGLEGVSTGLLNYHLKILDDLLSKDEDGKYLLTEKGKLASRLLLEFPEPDRKQLGLKPKWWRKFWITTGAIIVLSAVCSLTMYFFGYVNLAVLLQSFLFIFAIIGTLYMTQHIVLEVLSEKNRSRILRAGNFARGLVVGFLLWFALTFGVVYSGFSQVIYDALGRELEITAALSSLIFCLVIGVFIGNRLAKRYYPIA